MRQGKKVADGRCGITIEAKPVFDQTCQIEDVVAAPDETQPEGFWTWRPSSAYLTGQCLETQSSATSAFSTMKACRVLNVGIFPLAGLHSCQSNVPAE